MSSASDLTSNIAERTDADAAGKHTRTPSSRCILNTLLLLSVSNIPLASKAKYHVQSIDETYEIYGVDAIWHNMYVGPETDFITFRMQYESNIDAMILMVARHVAQGLYSVISMNATPHMLTVICGCERMQADLGLSGDLWADPARG